MADIFRWEDGIVMHLSFSEASVVKSLLGIVSVGVPDRASSPQDRATHMYGGLYAAGVDEEAAELLEYGEIVSYSPYPEGRYK